MEATPLLTLERANEVLETYSSKIHTILDDTANWNTVRNVKLSHPSSPTMRLMKYPWKEKNQPSYVTGASCTLPNVPIQEFFSTIIHNMPTTCFKWDKTVLKVNTLSQLSPHHIIYHYIFDPGRSFIILSKRDMVYLDSWYQDPESKRIFYVGTSLPELQSVPAPDKNTVRSILHFHCKRLTPVNDGKGTFYETAQLVDLKGNLPNSLAMDAMLQSLYEEIEFVYGTKGSLKNK